MSSFYRRRYRGYRVRTGYGRRGYNRSWRRGWYRSRSTLKSQQSGRRMFSVTIPTSAAFSMSSQSGSYWTNIFCVNPYFYEQNGPYGQAALPSSLLYRVYTQLYDQVKVNGVTIKISIMSNIGTGGLVSAVKVCSCWDRDAQYTELVESSDPMTTDRLQMGSESQSQLIVNNSKAIVYRSNWAGDIMERSTYHDCTITQSSGQFYDVAWRENGSIGYCPALYFALQTASAPGAGGYNFSVAVEAQWRVTFRNPKFGLSSNNSKGVGDLGAVAVKSDGVGKSVSLLPSSSSDVKEVCGRLAYNLGDSYEGYSDGSFSIADDVKIAVGKLGVESFRKMFGDNYDDFIDDGVSDGALVKEG